LKVVKNVKRSYGYVMSKFSTIQRRFWKFQLLEKSCHDGPASWHVGLVSCHDESLKQLPRHIYETIVSQWTRNMAR